MYNSTWGHWPDWQRCTGSQSHDEVRGAVESWHGRGQLDGWEQASPAGGEHRQNPVLTGHGNNIAEDETPPKKGSDFQLMPCNKDLVESSTCSLRPWPPSSEAACSTPARLSSIAAGWVSYPRPLKPRSPPPGRQTAPCWPEHSPTPPFVATTLASLVVTGLPAGATGGNTPFSTFYSVTWRVKAFFMLGVESLRATGAAGATAAALLGSRSAGGVICREKRARGRSHLWSFAIVFQGHVYKSIFYQIW